MGTRRGFYRRAWKSSGLSAWAGIIAAPVVLALIGLLLERLVIRRFYTAPIIAMLGTYAIGRRGPSALGLVDAG